MSHRLFPINDGEYLEPNEIVRRLKAEFDYVDADTDAGTGHVADMLKQFERMNAPAEIIEVHRAMLGKAIRIVFSDRTNFENDYIRFTAMPGEGPLIGYCSRSHEYAATPLLERACKILRYRSELV